MSKTKLSKAILTTAFLCLAFPQSALSEPQEDSQNPLSEIFGVLKRAISPNTTELERLIAGKDYLAAAEFLIKKAADLGESDLKKFKSLIAPEIQKIVSGRTEELERVIINESTESIIDVGRTLSAIGAEWRDKIQPSVSFLALSTQDFIEKLDHRQAELYRFSEMNLKNAVYGSLVVGEDLNRYKEIARQIGVERITPICEEALGNSGTRRVALQNCSLLLSPSDLENLRINAVSRDLEVISPSQSAYERVVQLSKVSKDWRLSTAEWEKLVLPRLPTIIQVPSVKVQSSLLSNDRRHAVLIKKSSKPTQKISKETRRSEYVSGQIIIPNSRYLEAQRRYEQATYEYQNCNATYRVQRLSNPYAINLCGLILPGIERAQAELAATSPTISQEQKTSYEYEVDNVSVEVTEEFILALYSAEKNDYFFKPITAVRGKSFSFSTGIHPQDRSVNQLSFSQDKDIQEFLNNDSQFDKIRIFEFADSKDLNFGIKNLLALVGGQGAQLAAREATSAPQSPPQQSATTPNQRVLNSIVVVNTRNSIGSGFYVRPRFILTNEHVVQSQSMVEIELRGGEKFTGIVVATDALLDLALIAVPKDGHAIQFSKSDPSIGSEAIALGHPRGLKFSLTRGVVSAIRELEVGRGGVKKLSFIQTDVAINPGNSGGPLVVDGLVVGINTFKIGGKSSEGLGFALSASEAISWLEHHLPR